MFRASSDNGGDGTHTHGTSTLLSVLLVTVLCGVNCCGVRVSASINNFLAVVKILLILALLVAGIVFSAAQFSDGSNHRNDNNSVMIVTNLSFPSSFDGTSAKGVGTGMIACLWAYEGW